MPQVSATLKRETINDVKKAAESLNRSFSETVEILLERAIKERNRKKTKND